MMELTQEWQGWLLDNAARGCSAESMIEAMVKAGFESIYAQALVQVYQRGGVAAGPVTKSSPAAASGYVYDAWPMQGGNRIDGGDRTVAVSMRCDKPQVLILEGVLSDEECDEVIRRSRTKLRRSTTVNPKTGGEDVIENRTSEGTFFGLCEDEFITRLDTRISKLMNWPVENGEGLQILRYGVGGEYTPHFDYFPPGDPGSATHISRSGQRVATMVLYLNDVHEGGATIFPDAGLNVTPRKGAAVYFRYFNGQGQIDPLTLHGGAPVTAGEKWIMTKWMRERPHR